MAPPELQIGDVLRLVPAAGRPQDDGPPPLERCPSVYDYGDSLHLYVHEDERYVVCGVDSQSPCSETGYVLAVQGRPDLVVGFGLFSSTARYHTRITQVGHDPEPVRVEVVGRAPTGDVPIGRRFVGSCVMLARRAAAGNAGVF